MKKNTTLIVVIIAVLLLCCCSIAGGAGVILLLKDDDNDGKTTKETTKNTTKETTIVAQDTPPTVSDVKDTFMNANSYSFNGELVFDDGYVTKLQGEYLSPDKEDCYVDEPLAQSEEITIGDTIYVTAQGGGWSVAEEPYYSMWQRDEMDNFFDDADLGAIGVDGGTYWKFEYTDDYLEEDWLLLVDKNTGFPTQLVVSYENSEGVGVVTTIDFSDYNDPAISIEAPI